MGKLPQLKIKGRNHRGGKDQCVQRHREKDGEKLKKAFPPIRIQRAEDKAGDRMLHLTKNRMQNCTCHINMQLIKDIYHLPPLRMVTTGKKQTK